MDKFKLEILMTTYNGSAYLREQMDSILNQSYTNWHLTVSDDVSTDETVQILNEYMRLYPEKIRRVEFGKRFGSAGTHFMSLCRNCDADIIALCDQDDVWFPDKLEKMTALMREKTCVFGDETPLLVFTDQIPTDARLNPISDSLVGMQAMNVADLDWHALIFQNVITGGACMFNQALIRIACAGCDAEKIIMHDWWLGLIAARFGRIAYMNMSTGYYRQHAHNSVGAKNIASLAYVIERLTHLSSVYTLIRSRKTQAFEMQRAYSELLTETDRSFLLCFSKRRSGILFYLKNRRYIHGFFKCAALILLG